MLYEESSICFGSTEPLVQIDIFFFLCLLSYLESTETQENAKLY